jgi:hypothetical protein
MKMLMLIFDYGKLNILTLSHQTEMHAEKESVLSKREAAKEVSLQKQHAQLLKAMAYNQRIEFRQLRIKHELKVSSALASKNGSKPHSRLHSNGSSKYGSNDGSVNGSNEMAVPEKQSLLPTLTMEEEVEAELDNSDELRKEFGNIGASLQVLAKRHKDQLNAMDAAIKKELNDLNLSFEVRTTELEEMQNNARIKLIEDQERDVEELKEAQEKEIRIEEMMVII